MIGEKRVNPSYDDLSSKLIEEFPELRERYENELAWWGTERPGQHIIFGDIFVPYLVELLQSDKHHSETKRAFGLIEVLLSSEDIRVQEVAVVTVLEYLQDKPSLLKLAEPFLRPLASRAIQDLARFWDGKAQINN